MQDILSARMSRVAIKSNLRCSKKDGKNVDGKTTQYMFSDSDEEDAMLSLTDD